MPTILIIEDEAKMRRLLELQLGDPDDTLRGRANIGKHLGRCWKLAQVESRAHGLGKDRCVLSFSIGLGPRQPVALQPRCRYRSA